MNKITLRFLFFTGLAAIFCVSCSKDKDLPDIPDSYNLNDSVPFSVEVVPPEGCDTLIFFRIKNNDNIKTPFNPTDASLEFKSGDSIILETRAKNGYTFINWVRDGNGVSNDPIYGFKLDSLDIDTSTHFVKHHYEARFGLDYALQVIPPIDSVIPIELIKKMGPYLHFGDNPPRIESFSFNSLRLVEFIHNPDIPFNSETMYSLGDNQVFYNSFEFEFYGQHRGVFDSCSYLRNYGPMNMPDPNNPPLIINYLHEFANTPDSIFIMGNGNDFTIYYHQSMERRIEPNDDLIANNIIGGIDLTRVESVIISGTITDQGISDFHWGYRVERYNKTIENVWITRIPGIHDMFLFDNSQSSTNP